MDSDIPLYFLGITVLICALTGIIVYIVTKKKYGTEPDREEIISLVNEGHESGEIQTSEADMISNIFEFEDKDAKDIMIHRGEIVAIDGEDSLRDAVEILKNSTYSRFPVYLEDLDNIIGTVHMKELFLASLDKVNFPKKIKDIDGIMRDPIFIPETNSVSSVLSKMKINKSHLVLIKDEYGQTSGLLSMEDILEEIVGNIFDEHDEEDLSIIKRGNGVYIMFGRTELSEISELLSLDFETEDIETLNGFLINEIGRIPKEHETFSIEYKGYNFKVMDVKSNMILAVKVERILDIDAD